MEQTSISSTLFIAGKGRKVKVEDRMRLEMLRDGLTVDAKEEVVTPGRLELPTRSLGNCCSIHLSYGAALLHLIDFD
jgi:hypothetical protein